MRQKKEDLENVKKSMEGHLHKMKIDMKSIEE
jgi:hypothetical protein